MDFVAARYSHVSPLAKKLFAVDGVKRVFYGHDYISIAKKEELEWSVDTLKFFFLFHIKGLIVYRTLNLIYLQ